MSAQTIPKEIWYQTILNLGQQDLYTLAQVSVFFRTIINDDYIWRECLMMRYGKDALPDPTLENPPTCREVYEDKAQLKLSITSFSGPWFDDTRYWRMRPSDESVFGKVAYLNLVWWLSISTTIPAIAPGTYEIIWRYKPGRPMSSKFTLYVEPKSDDTDVPKTISFEQRLADVQSDRWIEAIAPERLVIKEKHGFVDVTVGIDNTESTVKSEIDFDYVYLRALSQSEIDTVPNTVPDTPRPWTWSSGRGLKGLYSALSGQKSN